MAAGDRAVAGFSGVYREVVCVDRTVAGLNRQVAWVDRVVAGVNTEVTGQCG